MANGFEQALGQVLDDPLLAVAAPLFVLAMGVEVFLSRRSELALYQGRDFAVSMAMLVLSSLVDLVPKVLAVGAFVALHELSPLRDLVVRQWWAWAVLFFFDDFLYYWFHRANHEVRLLWAGHVPHHSSLQLNFGTALRQGVGERLHKYVFWLPLPLLGFDAVMVFTMISLNLVYQFWVHTQLVRRLPRWVEAVFNTPSHHRVHHASNPRYLDRNHGGVLIIWDRWFGTFAAEDPREPCRFGLTENLGTFHPVTVAAGAYRLLWRDLWRAPSLSARLRYLFLAPGWRHDGPDRRSKVLRQRTG